MKRLAVLAVVLSLLAPVAPAKSKKMSLSGWLSDTNCARKSAKEATGPGHADCARKCASNGGAAVFVTEPEHRVYGIDNVFMVQGLEGLKVSLTAEPGATSDVLHIISVMPQEDPGAAPAK